MPLENPLDSIREADLQDLITDKIAEGKTIEYKVSLPDKTYDSKKEFLADVSSFANAAGGHLVFGMTEDNGIPVDVRGLPGINPDAEILRLESLMRDGIEPRIPGTAMRAIPLSTSDVAIVVRVPRSWAQPHVVNYQGHWRFYTRSSAGKYPLDVSEVRAAFALSETLAERVRLFRTERLGRIVAGETPVLMDESGKVVLHIVPFGAFDPSAGLDIFSLGDAVWRIEPIYGSVASRRYNLDGLVTYGNSRTPPAQSYLQLFRNGIIETVGTSILIDDREGRPCIPSIAYEKGLLDALPIYLSILEQLGVAPPLFVMLSLLGVSGCILAINRRIDLWGERTYPIDRDTLVLPEIVIESFEVNAAAVMRPIFDSVWNAAGWPRSMNYDESGEWG
jgi:hypothetical protein